MEYNGKFKIVHDALLNNSVHVFTRRLSTWTQLITLYNMGWWDWRRGLHQKWRKIS